MTTIAEYLDAVIQVKIDFNKDMYWNECNFCSQVVDKDTPLYWWYESLGKYRACAICFIELHKDWCLDCYDQLNNVLCESHSPIEHPSFEVKGIDRINYSPSDTLMSILEGMKIVRS